MKNAGNEANSEKKKKRSDMEIDLLCSWLEQKGETLFLYCALGVFTGEVMVLKWSPLEESAPINNGWLNRGLDQVVKDGLFFL
ncbi:hypothetical protein Gotur_027212 [Gossypium turneri]